MKKSLAVALALLTLTATACTSAIAPTTDQNNNPATTTDQAQKTQQSSVEKIPKIDTVPTEVKTITNPIKTETTTVHPLKN